MYSRDARKGFDIPINLEVKPTLGHKININIPPLQQLTKKFCNLFFFDKKFGGFRNMY